jgi:membrane-bound lytic murein transglycosylase MltF
MHGSLLADGYPNLAPASVIDSLLAELQEEQADIAAAVSVFQSEATGMTVTVGEPRPKE